MTLIAVLISLAVDRFLGHLQELRRFDFLLGLAARINRQFGPAQPWSAAGAVVLALLPALLLIGVLQAVVGDRIYGLPGLVLGIVVLLLTLGPRDLQDDGESYIEALERGDEGRAALRAGIVLGAEPPAHAGERTHAVADALLVRASEALFAVLFWFAVLGPLGALLYRLAWVLKEEPEEAAATPEFQAAALRLHGILVWLPARLVALGYALAGSFEEAVEGWRQYRERWQERFHDTNVGVLVCTGNGALRRELADDPAIGAALDADAAAHLIRSVLGLVWRTLVIWVTVLALLTLAGAAG
jgi:AmpE protein